MTNEKAQQQNKFVVLNKKHIERVQQTHPEVVNALADAIIEFSLTLSIYHGKDIETSSYYVCNKDEPYSQDILDIILTEEGKRNDR